MPALAQAPAGKPDLERAQKTASEVCLACHGPNGNSVVPANPSLAGQPAEYITLQLEHFKAGVDRISHKLATQQPITGEHVGAHVSE